MGLALITPLNDAGLQGLNKSSQGLEKSASKIASAGLDLPESGTGGKLISAEAQPSANIASRNSQTGLEDAMVQLKVYEQSFNASAKVIKVASESLGTLLDTSV